MRFFVILMCIFSSVDLFAGGGLCDKYNFNFKASSLSLCLPVATGSDFPEVVVNEFVDVNNNDGYDVWGGKVILKKYWDYGSFWEGGVQGTLGIQIYLRKLPDDLVLRSLNFDELFLVVSEKRMRDYSVFNKGRGKGAALKGEVLGNGWLKLPVDIKTPSYVTFAGAHHYVEMTFSYMDKNENVSPRWKKKAEADLADIVESSRVSY